MAARHQVSALFLNCKCKFLLYSVTFDKRGGGKNIEKSVTFYEQPSTTTTDVYWWSCLYQFRLVVPVQKRFKWVRSETSLVVIVVKLAEIRTSDYSYVIHMHIYYKVLSLLSRAYLRFN